MRDAVFGSTARTPIVKTDRRAFINTAPQTLAGHAIRYAAKSPEPAAAIVGTMAVNCRTAGARRAARFA